MRIPDVETPRGQERQERQGKDFPEPAPELDQDAIKPVHRAQTFSYLRVGEFQLALLINFNVTVLRDGIVRIVWTG